MSTVSVRAVSPASTDDIGELATILRASWGTTAVLTRGRAHDASGLPGYLAKQAGHQAAHAVGRPATLGRSSPSTPPNPGAGVGTAPLDAVRRAVTAAGIPRLWLVTTNDNLDALEFFNAAAGV